MVCLADDKAQDRQVSEAQKSKEMLELRTRMDNLKPENNQLKDLRQKTKHRVDPRGLGSNRGEEQTDGRDRELEEGEGTQGRKCRQDNRSPQR